MDSIFRLDAKGLIVLQPAAMKLVPEFSLLSEKELRYLILAYDSTNTIFKQQRYSEWQRMACDYVFGHKNFLKVEASLEPGILKTFQLFVYDEERIQKAKMTERKRQLQEDLLKAEGTQKMKAIVESIKMLEGMINDSDSKITNSDEEVVLANKQGKLSVVEKWQRRQKQMQQ